MLIYKCDSCKKIIRNYNDMMQVDYCKRPKVFSFCEKCAVDIIKLLKRLRLIDEK